MKSNHSVYADVTICIHATGEKQNLQLSGLHCEWVWAEGSREAAEYQTVEEWVVETFGDIVESFNITCVVSSPIKGAFLKWK